MTTISRTLALLKPVDLFPAWKWIDMMEEYGKLFRAPLSQSEPNCGPDARRTRKPMR